jgi:hypothetical protein
MHTNLLSYITMLEYLPPWDGVLDMTRAHRKIVLEAERPEALNHGRAERLGITPPVVLHVRNLLVIPVYGCIP